MRVIVVGGGVAGLSAAYELAKAGHSVRVFEELPELGGDAAVFPVAGTYLERFYHHLFTSDSDILDLLSELGLAQRLRWLPSRVGIFHGGKAYPFTTPGDLLRFRPIPVFDRLRLGLVALYLRRRGDWRGLEGITAAEWIRRYAGRRNYEAVWGPLLRSKFGASADEVGMVWFWGKIHLRFASRGPRSGQELLGYLDGSFGLMIEALAQRLLGLGAEVYVSSPAEQVLVEEGVVRGVRLRRAQRLVLEGGKLRVREESGAAAPSEDVECDAVICCTPSYAFLRIAEGVPEDYLAKVRASRYQAALCLVLITSRSLSDFYWLNIADPSVPFVAVIEHTNLVESAPYEGKHIVYLSNYLAQDSHLYQMGREELLDVYLPHLRRINPHFEKGWIEEAYLFRSGSAQPIISTYYSRKIPELTTGVRGLFLANPTQIYPEDRGMNYSIRLGREVARLAALPFGKG